MQTDTLTREDIETSTSQNLGPEDVSHWIRKRFTDGMSGAVEALCGYVFVPMRNPKGLPICQGCKAVYEDDLAMSIVTD